MKLPSSGGTEIDAPALRGPLWILLWRPRLAPSVTVEPVSQLGPPPTRSQECCRWQRVSLCTPKIQKGVPRGVWHREGWHCQSGRFCLKGLSQVLFSSALAALTILVFVVLLFLGGGIRYRAPWFDGANEGPCLSVYTGVQQQCVARGRCSAATAKSGTVRSAGLPAECEWISDGPSAPHTSHVFRRSFGSSRRRRCLEDQENQIRTCERHFCQSYHPGWMVCSRCSLIRGIPVADTGICFATRSEEEEAMRELRSGGGLTILTTKQIVAGSEEIEFEVKTSQGLSIMWKRYLVQLGDVPVTYKCSAPRGGAAEADTSLVVIGFHNKYCHPDPWRQPRPDRSQLPHTGSRSLVRSPWTSYHPDPEGPMVSKWWPGFRRQLREGSSRKRGVRCLLSLLLCQRRRPPVQGCPTPSRIRPPCGYEEGEGGRSCHPWVVLRRKGLGLRTKECDFESVVGQVYSEEESKRFIGERWEATDLPLSWSKAAVQAFLAGWPCTVEASFRAGKTRSAIIRSAVPPPHRRLQHDFGCSLIRPAEPRKRQNAQVLVWSKSGKTTAESQKAAKSWASVVRGNPTPPVTAKRPLAGSESMDTSALGAINPTQVQDNNQGHTQVSLSPRSQRFYTLQPPQSPVLADVVAQLQVLMASVQSIATTVG